MSVLNEEFKDTYVGRTDTGPYAITFDVNLDDGGNAIDIVVKHIDSVGAETDITSVCTVTGMNVYTTASYAATDQVVLIRYPALTQPYTFPFGTQFPSRTFEKALDRLLYTVQRLALETEQSLKVPIGEAAPSRIPSVDNRGNKYAAYDAAGDPIAAVDPGSYPASVFMATLLDDTSASVALQTLGWNWSTDGVFLLSYLCIYNGGIYLSLQTGNVGHNPATSPTWWRRIAPCGKEWIKRPGDAAYIILDADIETIYLFSTTLTADRTLTLPTAADNEGRKVTVINAQTSAFKVIIDGEGTEKIGEAGTDETLDLATRADRVTLVCDGTLWLVIE